MSDNKTPVTAVPTQEQTETESEKPSFLAKTKQFARNHKKPLIAGGLLTVLVAAASVAGRKTEELPDFDEVSPKEETPETESESADTTVA